MKEQPMANLPRRSVILLPVALLAGFVPSLGGAAPTRYKLDDDASRVEFLFTLGGGAQKGVMPVAKAVILLDPANLAASHVDITLLASAVRTPLPFAQTALVGPEVLDVAQHPTIRFVSTKVKLAADGRLSVGATITGNLTLRGVTRPLTLQADLFRAPGSAADDLSNLSVHLRGQISRSDFGATGFADLVADTVGLNIRAVIRVVR